MSNEWSAFFIGVLFSSILIMVSLNSFSNSYHSMAKTAIQECEKSLPRDQTCKVIAVPAE